MAFVVRDLDERVAHMAGVKAAVYEAAKGGAARAEAVLTAHRHQGHARITVTRGSVDAFVNLDDTRGQRAAAAIEYGRSGGRGGPTQGIYALRSAF
jgi:hypothetical protein